MKTEFICLETMDDCRNLIKKIINDLGYKILEDEKHKIFAKHGLSLMIIHMS